MTLFLSLSVLHFPGESPLPESIGLERIKLIAALSVDSHCVRQPTCITNRDVCTRVCTHMRRCIHALFWFFPKLNTIG